VSALTDLSNNTKQKVGGKVKDCNINLCDFVASVRLYVTILGSYDIVIGIIEKHVQGM
jgi:hypothetical protein